MTPLLEQFKILQVDYPQAQLTPLLDGSHLIAIPDFKLPLGWSKQIVTIKFLAPVGYPFGRPDCFWTDFDLKLANGNPPQRTGGNPIPNVGGQHLWFSWHLSAWNPNSDNLLTYVHVIKRRFNEAG
jgi:hypothetical protein